MEVLFSGNLEPLSSSFFQIMMKNFKIVVCEKDSEKEWESKYITPYDFTPGSAEFRNIFKTYNFDATIYISNSINNSKNIFEEFQNLESTLSLSKENKVKLFVYILSNEFNDERKVTADYEDGRKILMEACENLCLASSHHSDMYITVIRVPYLYSLDNYKTPLGHMIQESIDRNLVCMPGPYEMQTDFLAEEDLSVLLSRILDEPFPGYKAMNLSGDLKITFGDLGELFREMNEEVKITYNSNPVGLVAVTKDTYARKEYGWFPVVNLEQSLYELNKKYQTQKKSQKRQKSSKRRNSKLTTALTSVTEIFVLFAIMQLLHIWVAGNTTLKFFDFRLLFVVLMGTIRGLYIGIIAAFMACVSYVFGLSEGLNWQITFYNIQNWLPFAVYFLVGAISGYTRDKNQDHLSFAVKEQELLEKKYVFLSELYAKALQNKDEFNNQIISYSDSYGRIYDMVKRLNTTLPDKVFYEAIQITEDILNNAYVAIYTVDEKSDFARLAVCSKALNTTLAKSLKLSDYPNMIETLEQNETWINTACIPDYPVYATPIFRENHIGGLILLMNTSYQQMSMEFANKFNIVTGLIKDSLLRAMERVKLTEKDTMIPDTRILNAEQFKKVVEVKKQMKESDFSEYLLIQLHFGEITFKELSEIISQMVRNQDVLGQGEDGGIYLLLSQTNKKYVSLIADRLSKKDITFTPVG